MITNDEIKAMRERAIAWASDRGGNIVTRERAIGEEHMALDVLDLIGECTALHADLRDACSLLDDAVQLRNDAPGWFEKIDALRAIGGFGCGCRVARDDVQEFGLADDKARDMWPEAVALFDRLLAQGEKP